VRRPGRGGGGGGARGGAGGAGARRRRAGVVRRSRAPCRRGGRGVTELSRRARRAWGEGAFPTAGTARRLVPAALVTEGMAVAITGILIGISGGSAVGGSSRREASPRFGSWASDRCVRVPGENRTRGQGWSPNGAPWLQLVAIGGKSRGGRNCRNKPKPLPPVATSCRSERMVRRGSTVRVRQRALVRGKSPEIGDFCCLTQHRSNGTTPDRQPAEK